MSSFLAAFRTQTRVIKALVLREMDVRREGGSFVGIIWLFAEPTLITLIILTLHWVRGSAVVRGIPLVAFILTGYSPHLMLRHGGLAGVNAVLSNSALLYHRRVTYVDLVLARFFVVSVQGFVAFLLVYFAFYVAGVMTPPRDLGYFYLGWFLHIWFIGCVCFLLTGLALRWHIIKHMFMPVAYMMIPVYGAFFMLSWLPENVRNILLYFPPTNATEIIRRGYFGTSTPTFYNIPYTIECCTILTFFTFLIMLQARNKVEL